MEAAQAKEASTYYSVMAEAHDVSLGYKWTEVGVIPQDWTIAGLGRICSMKSGVGITSASIDEFSKYPCFGGNGVRGFTDRFTHSGRFALIGRQGALCGNVVCAEGEFFASEHAIVVTAYTKTDIGWLFYVLDRMRLNEYSESSAQPGLSVSKILLLPVARPPPPEQRAIAEALSDVDGLLRALEALIAKKKAIKQAAMQQLLTGKTRLPGFSGEWETKSLGKIGSFSKGRNIRRDDVLEDGHPCIRYGELYTRYHNYINTPISHISPAVADTALPIKTDDLLFAGSGETAEEIGRCAAFLGDAQAFAGGDIVVFRPTGQNSMFLVHLINHPVVATQKARFGQGDAVVHISAQNLALLKVCLPPREEQTAIATVLSDMDVEISALNRRRDKTRAVKQGMLQQLLTGRVRLVEPTRTVEDIAC